ncbi:MAG TPA: GntR family transcriptional regulator [Streptosporangiaceae bacterium]|jgi:DNA-binding GntR family transcriptional regulator
MGSPTHPVYLRVLADLRAQIRDGVLPPGARVPSRNAIIARYGVGETAAKHALQVLAAEGLIEAKAGSGSYVRRVPSERRLEHDRPHFPGSPFGLADRADPAGPSVATETNGEAVPLAWEHRTERVQAPAAIARRLQLGPGDTRAMRTRYLLTADGRPVQVATSYEPMAITEGTPVPLPEQGPFAGRGVIERMRVIGITVDQVVEEISVRPSTAAEAGALAISLGAPVLCVERVHLAGARVVETGDIVVAADQYRLRYRIPVGGLD